jgi:succinoglycan biosynthesis protein ExoA
MAGARVDVSVLVPVLNEAGVIGDTAQAMLAQSFDGRIEYLFIDGGSTDATREGLEQLAGADERVRVLDNPARRQSPALNLGLREARGAFVARMDAHTFYPPDYVERGVRRLSRGDVAWVGGPQLPLGVGRWSRRISVAMRSPLGIGGAVFRRRLDTEIETDTAFTGMWRRRTLEEVGGWDEEAVTNEDGELAARIQARDGRIVCVPEMAAECITRDSLPGLAKQYYRYGWGRVRTLRRHPETMRPSHVLPPALVLTAACAVIAPRSVARLARSALMTYGAAVALETARLCAHGGNRDAAFAPSVLVTMHVAWGTGFLSGCVSHGAPLRAISALVWRGWGGCFGRRPWRGPSDPGRRSGCS